MYDTLIKIRDNIKDVLGDSLKEFWIDDPNLIPQSSLPCLCVAPISTGIDIADNTRDHYTYVIDIILIINAKDELNKFKQEIVGTQYLTEKMEAKDSGGALMENTILYILRHNLTLGDNWDIGNVGNIDYSIRARGETSSQFVVKEATCRIEVIRTKNR